MRHLVLALMIVLLPLRGWIGDVMATEMVAGASAQAVASVMPATQSIAAGADHSGAGGHIDHQSMGTELVAALPDCAHPDAGGHADGATHGDACSACSACQVCHTLALSQRQPAAAAMAASALLPRGPNPQFASALAAPGQKPPIS